jgi:cbb3-type cytochrome oxidase subunit 3
MNDEISRLLLLAIFSIAVIVIADFALRRKDRDDRD